MILVACAVTYANTLNNPFLFDDRRAIEENPTIRELSFAVLTPPERSSVAGRPVANISFALNYAVGRFDVRGYHIVNVALHALTALLIFHVLRRTFARHAAQRIASADMLAFACALIWSVHTLNSEVVNYLAERTESLMALFYLLSLSCAIAALDSRRALRWELSVVGAAICAVNSKEPAVTLPAAIVLWDRIFAFPTLRAAWSARRRLYVSVTAACVVFAFLVRLIQVSEPGGSSWDYLINRAADLNVSPWTYLLNQGPIIARYLWLSIWPADLVLDYGFAQPLSLLDVWPTLLFVTGLLAAAVLALRVNPLIGFWALWFFLTLGPTSSVLPIAGEVGAERRMYLPLVGVIAVAILTLDLGLRRFRDLKVLRPILGTATVLVVVALAAATIARNRDYHSPLAVWQTSVDRRPHWRAHENLSVYLRDAGRIDESIAQLRLSAPHSPNSLHALGAALIGRGNAAEGIEDLRTFIRMYPKDPSVNLARLELAGALEKSGEIAEAATVYRSLLKERPENVIALSRLGNILAAAGNTGEAMALLQRAVAIEPRSTPLRTLTVQLQITNGQLSDAERNARELIGMAPKDAEAHNLLGVALASQDRLVEARDEFGKALSLNPGYSEARANQSRVEQRLLTRQR